MNKEFEFFLPSCFLFGSGYAVLVIFSLGTQETMNKEFGV